MRLCLCNLLVKLKHSSSDCHTAWNLKAHSSENILQVAAVGVESALVKLLSEDDLFLCRPRRLLFQPTKQKH